MALDSSGHSLHTKFSIKDRGIATGMNDTQLFQLTLTTENGEMCHVKSLIVVLITGNVHLDNRPDQCN